MIFDDNSNKIIKRPAGILFDFSDTLLSEEFDALRGNMHLLRYSRNPRGLTVDEVQAAAVELDRQLRPVSETAMIEFHDQWFSKLLYERLEISFSARFDLQWEFWKASLRFTLEPGIEELLKFLKQNRIKMGVVSNTSFPGRILERELQRQKLHQFFEFVISSADYGIRKPHPLIYELAVKKLNLPKEPVWFVGDNLIYDVMGPKDYGLWSIWYNRQGKVSDGIRPDLEIKNWGELIKVLIKFNHIKRGSIDE
jgi:putative hydrolase of the HAD superfamily